MKNNNIYDSVIENLCEELNNILKRVPSSYKEKIEEIRLRNGRPLIIAYEGRDMFVKTNGDISRYYEDAFIIKEDHIHSTFQLISNYSVYAYQEEIRNGYITVKGGHRVGIGGKIVYGAKGIETIKDISSLNIRIAREKKGISDNLIKYLLDDLNIFCNTLIISAPQCGKTTLLRDVIRNLSDGNRILNQGSFKVSIIDERSEIAGMYRGIPQKDIGIRTDILDGCLKSDGIIMAIRSMSPDIIAVDEIGGIKDIEAIHEALKAGIKLIATVHGSSLEEIKGKTSMEDLFKEKIFKRFIILDRSKGVGTISGIIDGNTFENIYINEGLK